MERTILRGRQPALTIVVLAAAVLLVTGCVSRSTHERELRERDNKIERLEGERDRLREEVTALREQTERLKAERPFGRQVTLYFLFNTPTDLFLVPVRRTIPAVGDPLFLAVEELIRGPGPDSRLDPVLPPNTRILHLDAQHGVATLDLGAEATRLNVGAAGEALVVAAIVNTLTEFPEVERVQILIEGKRRESLAGHIDIGQPLTRRENAILR